MTTSLALAVTPIALRQRGPKLFIRDSFEDDNGTSLDAHAPEINVPGNSWSEAVGNWGIQNNKAVTVADTNNSRAVIDAGQADVSISAVVQTSESIGTPGLSARYQDILNQWIAQLVINTDTVRIQELNAGVGTLRASASYSLSTATDYTLKFTLDGDDLTFSVDRAVEITHTSSFLNTETSHGFHDVRYDSEYSWFKVTAPDP